MITISKLIIYPFKSAKGIELPQVHFDSEGMTHDRRLMAVGEDGKFITARKNPELLQISCTPTPSGWILSHPQVANDLTLLNDSIVALISNVWGDAADANDAGNEASDWISQILNMTSRIAIWKPNARISGKYSLETTFADAAPILIASEASMKQGLEWAGLDNDYRRFRPNIIISGVDAFEEESWSHIQIGSATFELLDTCERCILTTRDPDTGEAHHKQEPIRALIKNHTNATKRPIMGMNAKLVSDPESAIISVNDTLSHH